MTDTTHKRLFFDLDVPSRLANALKNEGYGADTTVAEMAALLDNTRRIHAIHGLGEKSIQALKELVKGEGWIETQKNLIAAHAKIEELEEQLSIARVELGCTQRAKEERESDIKALLRAVAPLLFHATRLPLAAVIRWRGDDFLAALKEADTKIREIRRSRRR